MKMVSMNFEILTRTPYEEMLDILKRKYDGYHFGKRLVDIFNPFSILNAFNQMDMGSFWFKSGTPTYLVRLLSHFNQNLNEMIGKYYAASQFDASFILMMMTFVEFIPELLEALGGEEIPQGI